MATFLKNATISVIATLLAWAGLNELSDIASLAPEEYAVDFRFSDFYNLVADNRAVSIAEQRVAVVAVDGLTRDGIASALMAVNDAHPAAVGIDIAFWETTDSLDAALHAIGDRLVLPVEMIDASHDGTAREVEALYDIPGTYGAINVEGTSANSLVRHFWPRYFVGGDTVPSFAAALVSLVDPKSVERLYSRKSVSESIYYPSTTYAVISHDDLPGSADLIRDNIVIVGKLQDPLDHHKTPVDANMPGALIHASTVATILSGNYLYESPRYILWLIGTMLCLAMLSVKSALPASLDNLGLRVVQLLIMIAILLAGSHAFVRWNIVIDFVPPLVTISLGMAVCDVIEGLSHLYPSAARLMRKTINVLKLKLQHQ